MPATYEPIATTTVAVAAASVTFSSITSAYTDLRLVAVISNNGIGGDSLYITCNGDTIGSSSLYSETRLRGDGSTATSARSTSASIWGNSAISLPNTATGKLFATLDLFSYAGSTNKTALGTYSDDRNGSGSVFRYVHLRSSTAAITSLTLRAGSYLLDAGSTFTLYGIKNA
jgi:hypothetical protein